MSYTKPTKLPANYYRQLLSARKLLHDRHQLRMNTMAKLTPIEQLEQLLTAEGYRHHRVKFDTGYFLSLSTSGPVSAERACTISQTIRTFFPLALPWSNYGLVTKRSSRSALAALQATLFRTGDAQSAFYLYDSQPAHRAAMKTCQRVWNVA